LDRLAIQAVSNLITVGVWLELHLHLAPRKTHPLGGQDQVSPSVSANASDQATARASSKEGSWRTMASRALAVSFPQETLKVEGNDEYVQGNQVRTSLGHRNRIGAWTTIANVRPREDL
jgi:hypothetical protein